MFKDILAKIWGAVQDSFKEPELVSPLPKDYQFPQAQAVSIPAPSPTPTPTPTVEPRNPNWGTWKRQNPKGFEELLAGAMAASERTGVPADLLMDLSGLETSGGTQLDPPKGHTAAGYFMFNDPTVGNPEREMKPSPEVLPFIPEGFDRMSATQSAQLAADLMKERQELGRWAVARGRGAGGNTLGDFYSDEELAPYLR